MPDEEEAVFDETGPERTCIVTRRKGEPGLMLRFVAGPDGAVVPDLRARLPGRGAWVTADAETVAMAVKRKAFARAFKREVAAATSLPGDVESLLVGEALSALSFANKAGLVVAGAFKVEDALRGGQVKALLQARNGSADGLRKMEGAARRAAPPDKPPPPLLQIFESHQMDLALGRANVIHAALLLGGASDAFFQKAARLQRFRGADKPAGDVTRNAPGDEID